MFSTTTKENPKGHCNAIRTRSGLVIPDRVAEKEKDQIERGEKNQKRAMKRWLMTHQRAKVNLWEKGSSFPVPPFLREKPYPLIPTKKGQGEALCTLLGIVQSTQYYYSILRSIGANDGILWVHEGLVNHENEHKRWKQGDLKGWL